jgi:formylmethanofuran dehydrogenase subunit E
VTMNNARDRRPIPTLAPWDSRAPVRAPDTECSHCKNLFVGSEGMVTDGFALCPACDARD